MWTVTPDTPVLDALKLMAERDIGALPVLEGEKIVGIFSERDYARKIILKNKASRNTPVKEIMSSSVITVRPQQTVAECMALMARHRIRHLPVVDGNKMTGILSIGDVVQTIIFEQEDALQRLERAAFGNTEL